MTIDRRSAGAALVALLASAAVADVPPLDLGRFPVALAAPSGRWATMRFLALPPAGSAAAPIALRCAGAEGCAGELRLDDGTTRVSLALEQRPTPSWRARVIDSPSGRVVAIVELAPVAARSLMVRWSGRDGLTVARGDETPFRIGPAGFVPRRLEVAVEGGALESGAVEIAAREPVP